jgi:hypothetical protein
MTDFERFLELDKMEAYCQSVKLCYEAVIV